VNIDLISPKVFRRNIRITGRTKAKHCG